MISQRLHFCADKNGFWLFVDADWQTLTAAPLTEALGSGWLNQVSATDRDRVATAWQHSVDTCLTFKADYALVSGTRINHHASPTPQGFMGSLAVIEPAAQLTQLTEAICQPFFLEHLCDGLPAMVYQYQVMADGRDHFTYLSQSCASIFEVLPVVCLVDPQVAWNLVHPEDLDAFRASVQRSAAQLTPWTNDHRLRLPDGRIKWISGQALPSRAEDGSIIWNGILLDITDRKLAELALQDSEARFQNLTANIPGAIFRYLLRQDLTDAILYISAGCQELWELPDDAVLADVGQLWAMVHPEDVEAMYASVLESAANLTPWHWSWRMTTPSGQQKWVEASGRPQRLDHGDVVWDTVILDVSERKQAELHLQTQIQREQALNRITQAIRDSLDLDTIFATATRDVAELFQLYAATVVRYLPEQAEWRYVCDYCRDPEAERHPDYAISDHDNPFATRLKAGESVITSTDQITDVVNQDVAQTFPGTWFLVPLRVDGQTWGSLTLYMNDPAYRWSADQIELAQMLANQLAIAIQQAELTQQLQTLNEHLQQQVNQRTEALRKALVFEALTRRITNQISVSLNEDDILATVVEAIGLSLHPLLCNVSTCADQQPHIRHTYPHGLYQGGSIILPIEYHLDIYTNLYHGQITHASTYVESLGHRATLLIAPICQDGQTIGDILIMRPAHAVFDPMEIDLLTQVSDQCAIALRQSRLYQAAQDQVKELQRLNQLKDDFLSTISHELRTPLTSIKMATQMLSLHLGKLSGIPALLWQYLSILQSESNREIALINDLLEMARLEAGATTLNFSSIDLQSIIQGQLASLAPRLEQQQQSVELDLGHSTIVSDAFYLERILSELLFNASKYTPAEESIRVVAAYDSLYQQHHIAITNTGVSIPPAEQAKIFDKFYRIRQNDPWKHGGTGLGLALVQHCAVVLGGKITVSSADNSTTLTVSLPARQTPP